MEFALNSSLVAPTAFLLYKLKKAQKDIFPSQMYCTKLYNVPNFVMTVTFVPSFSFLYFYFFNSTQLEIFAV